MSRHQLDTKTVFSLENYPDQNTKKFEKAEVDKVAKKNPETETIKAEPYHAEEDLVEAVNLAIALGRPLLLQGDPGCGKTRLAHVVAYALDLPLETFYIKSTSAAQDLLYSYDAVSRLYDAEMKQDKSKKAGNYIHYNALGRAIIRAQYGRRSVVLLDEIDKADLDFPNDLLWELDRLEFQVTESGESYAVSNYSDNAKHPQLRPIIIVTHNEEKPLPAAFLRRCIFHYVKFPKKQQDLLDILSLHQINNDGLNAKAVAMIKKLRGMDILSKKPGLSELIDWVAYLSHRNTPVAELETLPYISALLKQRIDQERARKQLSEQNTRSGA
ncbi:AAA family ATPase [Candidatus Venteria ishoeyi]|uniref:AAA domain (Dynein-related subfamily) n=1 Tax=Candidatus Venteria ishoeyi TaxID=1899563 RepID=A0A1H6FBE0_9GAMM|nr:MoxR family ATPase [Candidatus Venteria ishoeyi]SEH06315.1 AAA domain (dynein-related subfamily) [Candidatus Venteria ishoeyi]